MMPFLKQVAEALLTRHGGALGSVAVVLPSRRAGLYLRKYLAKAHGQALWSPELFTFPEFVERITGLRVADPVLQLFELYQCEAPDRRGPFSEFMLWAPAALRDMSVVDAHGIDHGAFYRDLRTMEDLENWSLHALTEPSRGQARLVDYWDRIGRLHAGLNTRLRALGLGTAGHVERAAAETCRTGSAPAAWTTVWFVGANALTRSQQQVLEHYRNTGAAVLAWDADRYYLDDPQQEAGRYLRPMIAALGPGVIPAVDGLRSLDRDLEVVEVPENVTQCWHAAATIAGLPEEERERTAVLLADESLLVPLLRALPAHVGPVNVTMGVPLRTLPVASLANAVITLHERPVKDGFLVGDLEALLAHPFLLGDRPGGLHALLEALRASGLVHAPSAVIERMIDEHAPASMGRISAILAPVRAAGAVVERIQHAIAWAKERTTGDVLAQEQLFQLAGIIQRLASMLQGHDDIVDLPSFSRLFHVLARNARIGFFGEPLQGLQIMGMLETRGIDHERLIVIGAQEGTLPPDGDDGGFIPHDIRRHFGLPLRHENEAVAAYSFFRSLQHAKKVTLIHSGGEESPGVSRHVMQLEHELAATSSTRVHKRKVGVAAAPRMRRPFVLERTPGVMQRIEARLAKGLSPSSLVAWSRCPLDFWFGHVLGLTTLEERTDRIGDDVIGSAVHQVMQVIHQPWVGRELKAEALRAAIPRVHGLVRSALLERRPGLTTLLGQPLLQAGMAARAVERSLEIEAQAIDDGDTVLLHAVERHLEASLDVGHRTVRLHGYIDRTETRNGRRWVVDLKTGTVDATELALRELDALPPDRPIAVQLLCYAWLELVNDPALSSIEAAALPLRDPSRRDAMVLRLHNDSLIAREQITAIGAALGNTVQRMLDPAVPITHDPESTYCRFCADAQ